MVNLAEEMKEQSANPSSGKIREILSSFRAGISEILQDQLVNVLLYGSHARGDAYHGSDIDVLIVISGDFDYFELLRKTSDLNWRLSLENDVVISRVFVSEEEFDRVDSPFLLTVHQDAVPV